MCLTIIFLMSLLHWRIMPPSYPQLSPPRADKVEQTNCPEKGSGSFRLEPKKPVKREIRGGGFHCYETALTADHFMRVIINQQGVNVVVTLFDPGGSRILEVDKESWSFGREEVMQVADPPGRYSLTVRSKDKGALAGRYEIEMVELRRAREADRALQGARGANANLNSLYQSGNFRGAIEVAEGLWEIRKRALGPEHPEVADILNNLGVLHQAAGDFTEAEQFYKDALTLKEKALGVNHPSVAKTLFNVADFYRVRGAFEEAERRYRRALTIFENTPGLDHLDVARANSAVASLYWSRGEYDKAEPLFRQSLAIREETLGENDAEVALARVRLAVLHHTLGDYARAESLYQRALPVLETTLSSKHKEYLGVLINLGQLRRAEKNYGEAEALYRRILDTLEESLGPEHPDVATALNNLAGVYTSSGELAKAEPLVKRALTIRENKFGREHSAVASSLDLLGQLLRAKGDYGDALTVLDRALAIQRKLFGPKNLGVARILSALATTYAAKGDVAQAVVLQARSNAITEHNLVLHTATGSERQRLIYLTPLAGELNQTVSYHLNYARHNPRARDLAVTTILRRKGRVLEAMSDTIGALRRRSRPQDQALFARLEEAQARLSNLVIGGLRTAHPSHTPYTSRRPRSRSNNLRRSSAAAALSSAR
jgi:tetratricopeptide (TPR) repeat protein